MKKKRLIPVLLLRNGWLVQSKQFRRYQNLGDPTTAVKRLSQWASDELIYLDISRNEEYDRRRDDLAHPNRGSFLEIMSDVSRVTHMPMTMGGRVTGLQGFEQRLAIGADKVSLNSQAYRTPELITEAAEQFGSQCVVVSIDARPNNGRQEVFIDGGRTGTGKAVAEWAAEVESRGAGEILLNAIDRDGARTGYDLDLIRSVTEKVTIPVIALGGVGEWAHLAAGLESTSADAVAAANIFHYTDQSVYLAKKYLAERGLPVRPPILYEIEPHR